jgi:long-chain acyl-CoA synthetase
MMRTALTFRGTIGTDDRTALRCGGTTRSFRELERRSNQLAHFLLRSGLEQDERLAIVCRNSTEFVETAIAARKAGLRATIISPTIGPRDMAAAVRRCDPRAIVTNMQSAVGVAGEIPNLSVKLFVGDARGFENYESALSGESPAPVAGRSPGIPMALTSGTTGSPKAVYRRQAYVPPYLRQLLAATAFDSLTDLALAPCGLQSSGVYNLAVGLPLQAGVGVIIADISLTLDVDGEDVLRTIQQERVTHLYFPNFIMRRLLSFPEETRRRYDLSSLKCVLHGGSAIPIVLKAALIDWLGPIVTEFYAGAEGGGTLITSSEWQLHKGSVGKPTEGLVRIFTPEFGDAAIGSTGRIYFRSPRYQRFEYFNDPAATREVYHGDYFTLGDLGHLDDEGYLYVTGRTAEVIDLSGYNVFPAEIDAVLLEHGAVAACAAVGLTDDTMGEVAGAVVVLRHGYDPTAAMTEELLRWCGARLTFKSPRRLVYSNHIPGFAQGKVNRDSLRRLFSAQDQTPLQAERLSTTVST